MIVTNQIFITGMCRSRLALPAGLSVQQSGERRYGPTGGAAGEKSALFAATATIFAGFDRHNAPSTRLDPTRDPLM